MAKLTARQGQYLAIIHLATKINGQPPSFEEIGRYFKVTPPTVCQMLDRLEASGFIQRERGVARSLRVLVGASELPELE